MQCGKETKYILASKKLNIINLKNFEPGIAGDNKNGYKKQIFITLM